RRLRDDAAGGSICVLVRAFSQRTRGASGHARDPDFHHRGPLSGSPTTCFAPGRVDVRRLRVRRTADGLVARCADHDLVTVADLRRGPEPARAAAPLFLLRNRYSPPIFPRLEPAAGGRTSVPRADRYAVPNLSGPS